MILILFWIVVSAVDGVEGKDPCKSNSSYVLPNGTCLYCPESCVSCISDTNCTICKADRYGAKCEHECPSDCAQCHKTYGHCTSGCADGKYAEGGRCRPCPENCNLCSSGTDCVVCKDGFFGKYCKDPCPDGCEGADCEKATGKCESCKKEYYNYQEVCHHCPDGCTSCENERNCVQCQSGYGGPFSGLCVIECKEIEKNASAYLSFDNSDDCIHGNLQSQLSREYCKYFRENKSFKCSTSRACVNFTSCSENEECGDDGCGGLRIHTCVNDCRFCGDDDSNCDSEILMGYNCSQTCVMENLENNTENGSQCLHNSEPHQDKISRSDTCSAESTSGNRASLNYTRYYIIIAICSVSIVAIVIFVAVVTYRCRGRVRKTSKPGPMRIIHGGRDHVRASVSRDPSRETNPDEPTAAVVGSDDYPETAVDPSENYDRTSHSSVVTPHNNLYDHTRHNVQNVSGRTDPNVQNAFGRTDQNDQNAYDRTRHANQASHSGGFGASAEQIHLDAYDRAVNDPSNTASNNTQCNVRELGYAYARVAKRGAIDNASTLSGSRELATSGGYLTPEPARQDGVDDQAGTYANARFDLSSFRSGEYRNTSPRVRNPRKNENVDMSHTYENVKKKKVRFGPMEMR